MAVAGLSPKGSHRSVGHPKVLRTPPDSPDRVRASYPTPGNLSSLIARPKPLILGHLSVTDGYLH